MYKNSCLSGCIEFHDPQRHLEVAVGGVINSVA